MDNTLKNKIIKYSAIKIIAKGPLLNSVLNPDTSSLSPSAKSNGVRLSSAITETVHIIEEITNIVKILKLFIGSRDLKSSFVLKNIILRMMKTSETS